MELISYMTNISNEAALSRVSPFLNSAAGIYRWHLDLSRKDKRLTVCSPGTINEIQVLDAIYKAGFIAISVEDICFDDRRQSD